MVTRKGPLKPGQKLRKYEIKRQLGLGGMGIVYEAWDPDIDTSVAIKWMDATNASNPVEMAQSFKAEAQTYARLAHSCIVPYRDYIISGSNLYMVTAFIEGTPLDDYIYSHGFMTEQEAARLSILVLDALGYAHNMGVIHRDLKPANVMLKKDGLPVILDFGISKSGGSGAHTQFVASQAYSLYYAPPEQTSFIGADVHTSAASDIFAWGVVIAQIVAGAVDKRYLPENSAQRLLHETVMSIPGLSPALNEIVMRAIRPHPSDRYQTASEMSQALGPIAGTYQAVPASPVLPTSNGHTTIDHAKQILTQTTAKRSKFDIRRKT